MEDMAKHNRSITLLVLLDAFRFDYLDKNHTPFLWELKDESIYIKKLNNPGGYCERSVFMTGTDPEVNGNFFAMSMMPVGYKRAYWEPVFNIPFDVRSRLCMTEDQEIDFIKDAFKNPDNGRVIESLWDVMRKEGKEFAVEACVALGVQQYGGITTHGTRPIQLMEKIKRGVDLAYIQFSETDQQIHYSGTRVKARKDLLKVVDSKVQWLYEETKKLYKDVNIIVFGDHGMMDVKEHIDLALEYPPYVEGWDYLYLKSSGAIQFWVYNPKVEKYILNDPHLKTNGVFIKSPSPRQGDLVWQADPGILISPCHFHKRWDAPKAMHGYSDKIDEMHGMAIINNNKDKKRVQKGSLKDICSAVCDLLEIRYPQYNKGVSYVEK